MVPHSAATPSAGASGRSGLSSSDAGGPPRELLGLDLLALERLIESLGEPRFRARQLYRWIYGRRAASFDAMTDLPGPLRVRLGERFRLGRPEVMLVQSSSDGTRKYVLAPPAGERIEAVLIPEPGRVTFCLSPQAGCALDCAFCMTARLGLTRNLAAGEIVGQALELLERGGDLIGGRPVNVVMMGMGEALHNYDNAMEAVRLLSDPEGVGIPARRITLSTAGLAPGIRRMAAEPVRPRLAVSLNATTDEVRSRIMPVNRRYPLAELLSACRAFPLRPRERLTFEYVLLAGVNDAPEDPRRLASLVQRHRLQVKVNLIPFNSGAGLGFQEPPAAAVRRFHDGLLSRGIPVSIRRNRGRDISAACGQLALEGSGPGVG